MKVKNTSGRGFLLFDLKFGMKKNVVIDVPKELEKHERIKAMLKSGSLTLVKTGAAEPADVDGKAGTAAVSSGEGKEFQTDMKGAVTTKSPPPEKLKEEKKENPENPIPETEENLKNVQTGKAPSKTSKKKKTAKKTAKKK